MSKRVFYIEEIVTNGAFYTNRNSQNPSLIVPQFLYCDVVISKTTLGILMYSRDLWEKPEKLKVAFNSCARYIYGVKIKDS
jgi:hypothetical protein